MFIYSYVHAYVRVCVCIQRLLCFVSHGIITYACYKNVFFSGFLVHFCFGVGKNTKLFIIIIF